MISNPRTLAIQLAAICAAFLPLATRAQETKEQQDARAKWPQLQEIIVVVKTHYDIGYTHRVKDVVQYYRTTMIDRALKAMDENKNAPADQQYAFTMPGWVLSKVTDDWAGQDPKRKARIDEFVKSGKFGFHTFPFSLESDVCEPEEMARGFAFADGISRRYNLPLGIAAKTSDVPSHGRALATVLGNSGVKFMHVGCNWPSGFVTTPGLFWWEGPDGSRVLTLYSSTYGSGTGFNWPDNWGAGEPNVGRHFLPPPNWPYKVWPAILVTMDNSGPPSGKAVDGYFQEARKLLPSGVKIRMGTMDDFAKTVLADPPSSLPVVKGEMPDTWIHGAMSDPRGSTLSREVHSGLPGAELLRTQLRAWGAALPECDKQIFDAYENVLLYGEHTWGVAPAVKGFGEDFAKTDPKLISHLESSWEDKSNYIREAARIRKEIDDLNLSTLAEGVTAAAGDIIVFNPLPWKRSGQVESAGKKVYVRDIPPCGYTVIPSGKSPEPADVVESPFYKLTLDPATGSIASLVDKRTGREWVDTSSQWKLGQFLNERFTFEQTLAYTKKYQSLRTNPGGPHGGMHKPGMISEKQVPYRAATSAKGVVTKVAGSAIVSCPADPANHMPATELRITLDQNQPGIDLELTIKDNPRDNWPTADWFCLPFKVENPEFKVYRQLGAMNPATDILPGANRDFFTVGAGVTLTGADGAGVSIMPLDHPLVSLDRPGIWKFSKNAEEFTPRNPVVFVNLFNNMWNTNFRYWYTGTWSSRVRLTTFDNKTAEPEKISLPALEARHPLMSVIAKGADKATAKLPSQLSGISVSRKGVVVTAFGGTPDASPGTLLRVWEMAGQGGALTVTLPKGITAKEALPVDLRGQPTGKPIALKDGALSFPLKAYAPASWILK